MWLVYLCVHLYVVCRDAAKFPRRLQYNAFFSQIDVLDDWNLEVCAVGVCMFVVLPACCSM